MSKFKTLLLMQLKEKIDYSFLKSKKETLLKVVFALLGFGAITVGAYAVLYICEFLHIFSPINHIPLSVMAVVFFVMFVLSLISCTIGLSRTLYFSPDTQMLITYPITSNQLFFSKLLVYFVGEIKRTFTFVIPVFFAYGILSHLPVLYYPWMIVMLVLYSTIPLLLGGILSVPGNFLLRFFKKYPAVKIVAISIVIVAFVFGVYYALIKIPSNINFIETWTIVSKTIRNFLSWFTKTFYVFYAFMIFLCGKYVNLKSVLFTEMSWIVLLALLCTIVALAAINIFVSRPLYFRIASKQYEFRKKEINKHHNNKKISKYTSLVWYETKKNFRDSYVFGANLLTLVVAPMAILLANKVYAAVATSLMGDYFVYSFNILLILLFVTANNINLASIFARDGDAVYYGKTTPLKLFPFLTAKIMLNCVTSLVVLTFSVIVFAMLNNIGTTNAITTFVLLFCAVFGHILWSAEIDILSPNIKKFQTHGDTAVSNDEIKSTGIAFALSFICFALVLFFLLQDGVFGITKVMIAAALFFALRLYLFYYKAKVLYKEM